ncbi:MAG: UvrD-helicase domain-containing protein, partial [Solobacterium sp.]|nr:UvrD-helicase domain-containing protein [Solobacterium sp.]
MRFDSEQTMAIEATGTNILVSASAGAGKTGVLVGRLTKRILRDRIPVSRILAMTFTQAAAAEMKKRLAQQLNTAYAEADDKEMKEWVSSQLIELESASITTIDSYCLSIIQKYCNVIGLNPAIYQNILDEGKKKILQKNAFYDAIEIFDQHYHEQMLTLLQYFSPRSEDYDSLYDIVCNINDHAQSDVDPESWYARAKNSYAPIHSFQDLNPEVRKAFFGYYLLKCHQMEDQLLLMKSSLQEGEKVSPESLIPYQNTLTNCIHALEDENYGLFCTTIENLVYHATPASGKNLLYTEYRKGLDAILKKILEICFTEKTFVQDHNDLTNICSMLVDLSEMSYTLFMEKKKEYVCMDFSDMERYAFDILNKNDGIIADIIRDSLDEIMVDEFQDTSFLQNEIIEKISNGKNVFRVGDVKQSIYRFRQAKPQLMRSLMEDPDTLQITLRHNYRSRQSIVGFTNLLFEKTMNIPGTRDNYL